MPDISFLYFNVNCLNHDFKNIQSESLSFGWSSIPLLSYNYCPIRFIFAIIFCVFFLPCLFSLLLFFLHFFFFLFSFTFQRQVFQLNLLYSPPTSSSWKFLTGIFSAVFSHVFTLILQRLLMLLLVAFKSLFLYLILESMLIWFSQVQHGFGLLSFILLVFLSCLKILSGLILNSGFMNCLDNDVYLRLKNFDGNKRVGRKIEEKIITGQWTEM